MAMLNTKWNRITNIQGSEPIPRHGHRAAVVKDLIIVFGGGNNGMVQELCVYNISINQWFLPKTKGNVPPARAVYGLVAHDDRLLMFGGMLEDGRNCNNLYELKVSSWEWKHIKARTSNPGSVPIARFGHSFTLIGEKVYLFGGLCTDVYVNKEIKPQYLNDLHTLNIRDKKVPTWEVQEVYGPAPSPRESHTAVAFTENRKSLLIVYGGMNKMRLGDVWFLNCDTMSWTQPYITGIPPLPRSLHSSTIIGHKMFIFGGWIPLQPNDRKVTQYAEEWKCTNTLAILNLKTLTWETVPSFAFDHNAPQARAGHCAVTALETRLYIWSGRDGYGKKWNNQICFKDFWFLETEVPPPPGAACLSTIMPHSLEIYWKSSTTAECYLLQLQVNPKVARESPIIDDKIRLSSAQQKNVSSNTTTYTGNTCSAPTVNPAYPNAAVQQLPMIHMPSSRIEPAATEVKSAVTPTAIVQISNDNFGASSNATATKSDQQYLESRTQHGQLSTTKIPLTRTAAVADIPQALLSTAAIVRTVNSKQKHASFISPVANTSALKPVSLPETSTVTTNSDCAAITPLGNKSHTTYFVSNGDSQVAPAVSAHQNIAVMTSEASRVYSSAYKMTTAKSVFATPTLVSSTGIFSNTASLRPSDMSVLETNSTSPYLEDISSKATTAASCNNAFRNITILPPRKQTAVQQNVEMPTQATAVKRQNSVTPVGTVLGVAGGTNTLPIHPTATVPNMVVSSAESNVSQLETQTTPVTTITAPIRLVKTREGNRYVVLQTKPRSVGVGEQGTSEAHF